jgi:hypothetical protein
MMLDHGIMLTFGIRADWSHWVCNGRKQFEDHDVGVVVAAASRVFITEEDTGRWAHHH